MSGVRAHSAAGSDRPEIAQRNVDQLRAGLMRLDVGELAAERERRLRTAIYRAASAVLCYSDECAADVEAASAIRRLRADRAVAETEAIAAELRAARATIPHDDVAQVGARRGQQRANDVLCQYETRA